VSIEPLRSVTGVAAVLDRPNLDTDVIIRIERMVSTDPAALAPFAFEALRYRPDGSDDPEFVLNQAPFTGAPILVGGPNFGCGSSREPAVWAIKGLGIRVIVAPSFGDIFQANCHQNGLLPVVLPAAGAGALAAIASTGAAVTVDVEKLEVAAGGRTWPFRLGATQRLSLLEGLDDLDLAMRDMPAVRAWENADQITRSWAWQSIAQDLTDTAQGTE
jgi:3-isopropylmalate/(R)-2-methylmalate dehydratase small subunit